MTFRVPSESRLSWTTTWMALAICLPHRPVRKVEIRHGHHGLESSQGVPRRVGVQRGQRPVVTRIHGLQHVDGLRRSHLTDHNPVRTHAEGVHHERALVDLALTLHVRRPGLQPYHVGLAELELGRVLDGHDALGGRGCSPRGC